MKKAIRIVGFIFIKIVLNRITIYPLAIIDVFIKSPRDKFGKNFKASKDSLLFMKNLISL